MQPGWAHYCSRGWCNQLSALPSKPLEYGLSIDLSASCCQCQWRRQWSDSLYWIRSKQQQQQQQHDDDNKRTRIKKSSPLSLDPCVCLLASIINGHALSRWIMSSSEGIFELSYDRHHCNSFSEAFPSIVLVMLWRLSIRTSWAFDILSQIVRLNEFANDDWNKRKAKRCS